MFNTLHTLGPYKGEIRYHQNIINLSEVVKYPQLVFSKALFWDLPLSRLKRISLY